MRALIAPALLTFLVAGCGRPEAPTQAARALLAQAAASPSQSASISRARPISGSCSGTFSPPPLPLPPVFQQTDSGTCTLSHLGESTIYGVQVIDFAAGTQSGRRTFTAANGDKLEATHTGTSRLIGPGLRSFTTRFTLAGGTGRFANATGYLNGQGVANLIARTTQVTFVGEISYDASDRSAQ